MKIRLFMLGAFFCSLLHFSCNDDLNLVGNGMRPGEDGISARTDTFQIKAETVLMDSVYAKSSLASLGEIYDPLYGYLKSDYVTQFRCVEDFTFAETPIDGKIDSVKFFVDYYHYITGDSAAALEVQLFMVTKPLERNYYSNFDPTFYSDMQTSMGRKTYTARDINISNEIWYGKDSNGNWTYAPSIEISMPVEFGQKIYDETINHPETFKNQQNFNEFIPGMYVTNTYGNGSIIDVVGSTIVVYYSYYATTKDINDQDSVYIANTREGFSSTREVIQLNRFENTGLNQLLNPDDQYVYLKAPAGVYTQLTIPTTEMYSSIEDRTINNIPFRFNISPNEEWEHAFKYPDDLVLIPKDSLNIFFEEINAIDGNNTFYARYGGGTTSTTSYLYNFGNISTVIQNHIKEAPEKDLELLLIPVNANATYNSSYTYIPSTIENLFSPRGAKIKKEQLSMIQVVSSEFER